MTTKSNFHFLVTFFTQHKYYLSKLHYIKLSKLELGITHNTQSKWKMQAWLNLHTQRLSFVVLNGALP
jgi:hypothetical protein